MDRTTLARWQRPAHLAAVAELIALGLALVRADQELQIVFL